MSGLGGLGGVGRLVPVVGEMMGDVFPELLEQQAVIEEVIREEEIAFGKTLKKVWEEGEGEGEGSWNERVWVWGGEQGVEKFEKDVKDSTKVVDGKLTGTVSER